MAVRVAGARLVLLTIVLACSACHGGVDEGDDAPFVGPICFWRLPDYGHQTDRIVQVTPPEIDVLWVVDGSWSVDERQELVERLPIYHRFLEESGSDFHLGAISTHVDSPEHGGRLLEAHGRRYVDRSTPDGARVFGDMLPLVGEEDTRTGVAATWRALEHERHEHNPGFLRDESSIHVVVVSDGIDTSASLPDSPSVEEFSGFLDALRPAAISFSAINRTGSPDPLADAYGEVSRRVGGLRRHLESTSWGGVLEELGMHAVGLQREFFLSSRPVQGSLRIHVEEPSDGNVLAFDEGEDWEFDPARNSIRFHSYVPAPLSTVILEYLPLETTDRD